MRRNIAQEARQIHMAPLMHLLDPLVKKVRIASASVGREVRNSKGDFAQIARAPRDSQLKVGGKLCGPALRRVLWPICGQRTIEPLRFNSGLPEHPGRLPFLPLSKCLRICLHRCAPRSSPASPPRRSLGTKSQSLAGPEPILTKATSASSCLSRRAPPWWCRGSVSPVGTSMPVVWRAAYLQVAR